MRKKLCRQLHTDNRGSAMITALIVSIVVIMFCLTALVVSYSLYQSSVKRITQDQCRELAKSVSLEIQSELVSVNYDSYADQQTALAAGEDMLWQYLRYNICQADWPYYQVDETTGKAATGHDENAAYRYFNMNVTGGDEDQYIAFTGGISVCIYWENENGDAYSASQTNREKTYLYVKVTCTRGNESATMTSKYALDCTNYENQNPDEVPEGENLKNNRRIVNPESYTDDKTWIKQESWTWTFVERE